MGLMGTRKSGKSKNAARGASVTNSAVAQTGPGGPGGTPAGAVTPEPETPAATPNESHRRAEKKRDGGASSPGTTESSARSGARLNLSLGGMLEDSPTSDWRIGKRSSADDDPRTLAELAEAVMKAAGETGEEPASPHADSPGGSRLAETQEDDVISGEPGASDEPQPSDERSRRGWVAFIPLIILFLVIGLASAHLGLGIGKFGGGSSAGGGGAELVSGGNTEPSPR